MARPKKQETVVVEEETTPTAWVVTEVAEEQPVEQPEVTKEQPVVKEKPVKEKPVEEKSVEEWAEQPTEEWEWEMDPEMAKELAEKEANAEKLLAGHTEVLKTEPVANGRGIPSQVITDPLGRKTTIYQPQTHAKNFSEGCKTVYWRRGEILNRNDVNKGNY